MPTPNKGESEKDFVSRCIPVVLKEGTAKNNSQGAAICHSMYKKHNKQAVYIIDLWSSYALWVEFEAAQGNKSTTVQTLIFSKSKFSTRDSAKSWAKSHGFTANTIRETNSSWRIRQRPDGDFIQTSFRTISLTSGVSAVIGKLKG